MFKPVHADQQHTIHFSLPPTACFDFFTPEGERLWVDDWEPAYYHRPDEGALEGTVFTTGHDGVTTWWTIVAHDPQRHSVRYSRVTPGIRAAIVDVRCDATAEGSAVTVRYRQVGLDDSGNALVRKMTGEAFNSMIEDWRGRISGLPPSNG